jgi:predicted membrane channel-forming protein YqfA (hemolysin III family)
MQDCTTTTIAFTLTNIIQFGIVMKVLTPPAVCYASCLTSALAGSTILPCFITIEHTLHSCMNWIYKAVIVLAVVCIPFASSVSARMALHYCFDENWYVWLVQGSMVPAMFWTTYRMLFDKPLIHDIVE